MVDLRRNHIHVTCAIIEQSGKVLAVQRSATMSHPLKWEFPGGKIKPGETPEECVQREVSEELGVSLTITSSLGLATHLYPAVTVTLYPFVCLISDGELTMHEHAALLWLPPDELPSLDWAEADLPVLADYFRQLER